MGRIIRIDGSSFLPDLEYCYDGIIEFWIGIHARNLLTLSMVRAQMRQESYFNPLAESPTGPVGLGQFTKATWDEVCPGERRRDIFKNIKGMVVYMARKLTWAEHHEIPEGQRWKFALAAYNQGAGNVLKAMRIVRELKGDDKMWLDVSQVMDRVLSDDRAREVKEYVKRIVAQRKLYESPDGGTA